MLVPIGSWCRTAYQVRDFLKKSGVRHYSYPYDWTITPFSALKNTLQKQFKPEKALQHENLALSKFGSIVDTGTHLIHHHDFFSHTISELGKSGEINNMGVPLQLFESDLIPKARGRFQHTYKNLEMLKVYNQKIGFIRWLQKGHPHPTLPDAFVGESLLTIANMLSNFLEHDRYSILWVKSIVVDGDLAESDIIASYEIERFGISATIRERAGFDGDGNKKDARGDSRSWHKLIMQYVKDENIVLG
jgi:hypothetical protein